MSLLAVAVYHKQQKYTLDKPQDIEEHHRFGISPQRALWNPNSKGVQANSTAFKIGSSAGIGSVAKTSKPQVDSLISLSASIYLAMYACVYIYTYIHTYIHTYRQTDRQTYMPPLCAVPGRRCRPRAGAEATLRQELCKPLRGGVCFRAHGFRACSFRVGGYGT